ncbi:MAG: putative metalloprotease CJM1_0395 family protein [Pseudomonadota bacterium]
MLPAIGSVSSLAGPGRSGVVVSARPIGDEQNGRQLVALKIRESGDGQKNTDPRDSTASPSASNRAQASSGIGDPWQADRASSSPSTAARLPSELTAAEKADVTRLQQRDQQVRQEEKAHAAVAGDLAGPINYTFQRGPDGRQYAVGGSVGIQASVLSGDPAEAARKAGRMAAAANAATNPSLQDYAAAREAYAFGSQLSQPQREEEAAGIRVDI